MKNKPCSLHGCPIHFATHMLGDKWSLLIIRDILFFGKRKYNEFLNSPESISTNILANRLVSLETDGLINKQSEKGSNKISTYTLTDKGLDLLPVLMELMCWSGKYDENCKIPAPILAKMKKSPSTMKKSILRNYQQGLSIFDLIKE